VSKPTPKELFEFIIRRVQVLGNTRALEPYRAFPYWFAEMYNSQPEGVLTSDGTGDGKVDFFFHTVSGSDVTYHVINSKYTETYGQIAPVAFYDEIQSFFQLFSFPEGRGKFIEQKVRVELRPFYRKLFKAFDEGNAKLLFLTTCRANQGQLAKVEHLPVETFHLEDLIQHVLDDLDGAMPRTPDLTLQQIGTVLSPGSDEIEVSTTIVFARLLDFIEYMENDPYELLFARNVRVSQGRTSVNEAIRQTFIQHPEQFAYSNNGITLLCERADHNHGVRELRLVNPRVVNGSQTLHAVREAFHGEGKDLPAATKLARVMARIVCIPPPKGTEGPIQSSNRKEITNRISIRSNQQNPIRAWNLRANDDFQMELARRFRQASLFYERRDKEWKGRSSQLKTVGVRRGPTIKKLMAQLACLLWKNPKLGPALAKGNLGELFQGEGYEEIREKVTPELAYQVYIVGDLVDSSLRQLTQQKYRNARAHIDLVVLSLVCRVLSEQGAAWRKAEFTACLEKQLTDWDAYRKSWRLLSMTAAEMALEAYAKTSKRVERDEGRELTLKNFVRRKDEVTKLLSAPLKSRLRKTAAMLVEP
jgi:hypothetical protein